MERIFHKILKAQLYYLWAFVMLFKIWFPFPCVFFFLLLLFYLMQFFVSDSEDIYYSFKKLKFVSFLDSGKVFIFMSSPNMGKFWLLLLWIISLSTSFSLLLLGFHNAHVGLLDSVLTTGPLHSSFFLNLLSFCSAHSMISVVISTSSLIISSDCLKLPLNPSSKIFICYCIFSSRISLFKFSLYWYFSFVHTSFTFSKSFFSSLKIFTIDILVFV